MPSGELEVFGCNKTSFLILSLSRTAKLWCVKAGENDSPNEDLVRRYCFNLDPFFVGTYIPIYVPTQKPVSDMETRFRVQSKILYKPQNTPVAHLLCHQRNTARACRPHSCLFTLLALTLLEVGLLDLLTEVIPIIKSRNLLK